MEQQERQPVITKADLPEGAERIPGGRFAYIEDGFVHYITVAEVLEKKRARQQASEASVESESSIDPSTFGDIEFKGSPEALLHFIRKVAPTVLPQQTTEPSFDAEVSDVPTYTPSSSFMNEPPVVTIPRVNETSAARSETLEETEDRLTHDATRHAQMTTPSRKKQIIYVDGKERPRFIRRLIFLGNTMAATAVIGALISGPAYQAAHSDEQATKVCAGEAFLGIVASPKCYAGEFMAHLSIKDVFNYGPESRQ